MIVCIRDSRRVGTIILALDTLGSNMFPWNKGAQGPGCPRPLHGATSCSACSSITGGPNTGLQSSPILWLGHFSSVYYNSTPGWSYLTAPAKHSWVDTSFQHSCLSEELRGTTTHWRLHLTHFIPLVHAGKQSLLQTRAAWPKGNLLVWRLGV